MWRRGSLISIVSVGMLLVLDAMSQAPLFVQAAAQGPEPASLLFQAGPDSGLTYQRKPEQDGAGPVPSVTPDDPVPPPDSLQKQYPPGGVTVPAEPARTLQTTDFTPLAASDVVLTCVTADPDSGLIYAQENEGTGFYSYDPALDAWWTRVSAPLSSGNNGGAAYLGGKIYTVYTENTASIGVYDVRSGSWTTMTNQLGVGTGDVASDGFFLYLVSGTTFGRYGPLALIPWKFLAAPPFPFFAWGGLEYWNGYLYGHAGNGNTDFAKYDIASDTWTTLPALPGGGVLGSAIDPVRGKYYAYGNYLGTNWYVFDLQTETWSVETIPFFTVHDGGMAYVSRGHASGVYFVQGESGTGFARNQDATPPSGEFEINHGADYVNTTAVTLNIGAEDPETDVSHMRFRNDAPWRALLFQDSPPWGANAMQWVLEDNYIPYDQMASSVMTSTDLTPYPLVIIPSVQGSSYFSRFNSNLGKFEDFIDAGGLVFMSFCTQGEDPPISLPFGGTNNFDMQSYNYIEDPSYSLFARVPNPYEGLAASHSSLTGLLPGDQVLVTVGTTTGGNAVMIERDHGAGLLLAGGQTFEHGWLYRYAAGNILEDAIPYLVGNVTWAAEIPWELSSGDGTKVVFGRFRNGGGLWTSVYSRTITLDTQLPTSSASSSDYDNAGDIPVGWTASDALSGPASTALWYKLGGGAWTDAGLAQPGTEGTYDFAPPGGENGTYHFATVATDRAGNVESSPAGAGDDATVYDTVAPAASASCIAEVRGSSFSVSWSGSDSTSGVATYDIQYRVETGGTWTNWLQETTATSAVFGSGSPITIKGGETYRFRARARDNAGNVGAFPSSADCATLVKPTIVYLSLLLRDYDPLTNGGFEQGWAGWQHGGKLDQSISSDAVYAGDFAALLGNPGYVCQNGVPLGAAWMEQTFTIPSQGRGTLRIYYRIWSQDKFGGAEYDRFQVLLNGDVVLMDGNQTDVYTCDNPAQSAGWEHVDVDVTAYAGQNVTLRLENWNAHDQWYNTWTYVDAVQLLP